MALPVGHPTANAGGAAPLRFNTERAERGAEAAEAWLLRPAVAMSLHSPHLPQTAGQPELHLTVVSRRHFFSVAPDWRHVPATMMVDLAGLRGFVGERG